MIFDAVLLQQLGLAIYLDEHTQEPTLGDSPKRLPAEADTCSRRERNTNMFFAILRLIWSFLTWPFLAFFKLLQSATRHPAEHSKENRGKRKVLPGRHDASHYKLEFRDRDSAMKHEAEQEKKDALSPLFDQLNASWGWHILEWIPQRVKKQKAFARGWKKGGYHWM